MGPGAEGEVGVELDRIAQVLARTELFAEIDPQSLNGLAAAATVHCLPAGTQLFDVGDPGDELFVVVEGTVRCSVTSKTGEEVLLSELTAPQAFGELALVHGGSRSAKAVVGQDAMLVTVSRTQLLSVLSQEPAAVEALLNSVGTIVRRLTQQFADRERKLIAQVEELKVQIDEARRAHEVAQLTDNEDFKGLRERAQAMRAARHAVLGAPSAGPARPAPTRA